ncbi:MAG: hypothetical protein IJ725_03110, partial [Ruminococcus sp.]|nr:hypothetical protein [Ruminococcus sp.]
MSKSNVIVPEKYYVKNALVNYYLVIMFTVFPLFVTEQFSNIRHDKFYLFIVLTAILVLIEIPMIIYFSFKREKTQRKWYKKLSFTDCSFAALILVFTVSTL